MCVKVIKILTYDVVLSPGCTDATMKGLNNINYTRKSKIKKIFNF